MKSIDTRILLSAIKFWRAKRVQAFLSALGVVAGVSGLVLVIALGEGANEELEAALGTLGAGSLLVRDMNRESVIPALPLDRVEAVDRLIGEWLERLTPVINRQLSVASADVRLDEAKVIATDRSYQDLYQLALHSGRFLSALDIEHQQRVCVLGWVAARTLFPRGQVLGQQIRLGKNWFKVVGWLKPSLYRMPQLENVDLSGVDNVIYVPTTSLSAPGKDMGLDELILQFSDEANMAAALATVKRILTRGAQDAALDFVVPIQLLRQKQRLQQIFQYLLLGIATLMLVVGGIGIMNIMMVNVISRRAEIGLRRAIGATRNDIIAQFVTESLVVAIGGGVIGVSLGFIVATLVNLGSEWPMVFNSTAAMVGFGISIVIGVVFGSYPARQAASVSPIRALNDL